jgi:hypothetical protein
MIRAGRNAALIQDFEEKAYVAVGWFEIARSKGRSKGDVHKIIKFLT